MGINLLTPGTGGSFRPLNPEPLAQNAATAIDLIEEMQDSGKYTWASDTLDSIYDDASRGRCTDLQLSAILNIMRSRR